MNEELWIRVEQALDARRPVADDQDLTAALDHEPGAQGQVALLERRLELLGRLEPSPPARRPAWRLVAPLAAACGIALGLWVTRASNESSDEAREPRVAWRLSTVQPPEPQFRERSAPSGRVLRWSVSGASR